MPAEELSNDEILRAFRERFDEDERLRELSSSLPPSLRRNLYEVAGFLREETKEALGAYLEDVYIYLQDPLVAQVDPELGVRPAEVRWQPGLADGPTNARLAVVDYNADTAVLTAPAVWNERARRFEGPDRQALGPNQCTLFQFHQVNTWAIVQRIIEMYEDAFALGRPIPWGTDGNRLIIVPHAGYGENAFYDRRSKALQFYYYGSADEPKYTCLSHDIVAHETGHALLDGIRPWYYAFTSLQTAAFHEFIADLTAILAALRNNDIRRATAQQTEGDLTRDNAIAALAEEFGEETTGIPKLRDANNELTMGDIQESRSPHECSQVLTGAMFEILVGIAGEYMRTERERKVSPGQALAWAAQRFGRIALQPLDFCPPVDIQFEDYARAVLRNFDLYEPLDSPRRTFYRDLISRVFYTRGLCPGPSEACADRSADSLEWDVYYDIDAISRSRTGAYYFLHDNRKALRIPDNEDIVVVDVYDTNKFGREALRLPREIVIQYMWREEFELSGAQFGSLQSRTAELLCGGTLVLDERGNVLSWFRKPGTQFKADPEAGKAAREAAEEDRKEGEARRAQLEAHMARLVEGGQIGLRGTSEVDILGIRTPPVIADTPQGALRLEITPSMRSTLEEARGKGKTRDAEKPASLEHDWDRREDRWTTDF